MMSSEAKAYFQQGENYRISGNIKAAIEAYTVAIELDNQYCQAYNNRGLLYKDQGLSDKALYDFNKIIAIEPTNPMTYYNRGLLYQEQRQEDKALEDYDKAIELNPDYAAAYGNRGVLYEKQGKEDKALSDYNKAIELGHVEAYCNRGNLYKKQGKLDKALEDYDQAIEFNLDDTLAWVNLSLLYSAWTEQELTDNGSDAAREIWQQAKDFAKEKLEKKIEQAKDLYLKAVDKIASLDEIEQQKQQQAKVLKEELHKGFSDKKEEFRKEEYKALKRINRIIIGLIILILLLMILLLTIKYPTIDLFDTTINPLFLLLPIYPPFIYWLILYTNRYASAKRKRQFYQHKAMIAQHIPVMVDHYKQTEQTEFVQKLHLSLYELPQYEHRTKLRLKVKDWVHAELEEHYKQKQKAQTTDNPSDDNKE